MKTNEQARMALALVRDLATELHEASDDGRIDVSEVVQILLRITPVILAILSGSEKKE